MEDALQETKATRIECDCNGTNVWLFDARAGGESYAAERGACDLTEASVTRCRDARLADTDLLLVLR